MDSGPNSTPGSVHGEKSKEKTEDDDDTLTSAMILILMFFFNSVKSHKNTHTHTQACVVVTVVDLVFVLNQVKSFWRNVSNWPQVQTLKLTSVETDLTVFISGLVFGKATFTACASVKNWHSRFSAPGIN